jgi:hypothetical protein
MNAYPPPPCPSLLVLFTASPKAPPSTPQTDKFGSLLRAGERDAKAATALHLDLDLSNPLRMIRLLSVRPYDRGARLGFEVTDVCAVGSETSSESEDLGLESRRALLRPFASPPHPPSLAAAGSPALSPSLGAPLQRARDLTQFVQRGATGPFLKLSGTKLTEVDILALPHVIAAHRGLGTVDMTDCGVRNEGATAVAEALRQVTTISALGLSGNKFLKRLVRAYGSQDRRCGVH